MKNDKENLDTELRAERVKCSMWKGNSHQSILDTVVQLFDSEVPYLASRFNTRTRSMRRLKGRKKCTREETRVNIAVKVTQLIYNQCLRNS